MHPEDKNEAGSWEKPNSQNPGLLSACKGPLHLCCGFSTLHLTRRKHTTCFDSQRGFCPQQGSVAADPVAPQAAGPGGDPAKTRVLAHSCWRKETKVTCCLQPAPGSEGLRLRACLLQVTGCDLLIYVQPPSFCLPHTPPHTTRGSSILKGTVLFFSNRPPQYMSVMVRSELGKAWPDSQPHRKFFNSGHPSR